MEDKEFDKLTPEEKKARFQKAVDDYNSGFVEVDYTFRSVASIRVEEAMEDAGRVSEEFKPAQIKVIYEAAEADLNLEHYMNPKFSASHMKFIMEQEKAGKDVTWLPIGKILHRSIVEKPLTRDQIRRIKERMQRAESKDSVIADLHEKKKEAARVPKKQGQQKEKDNVPEAKDISRNGKEVEAESVAYVVCQHYGINTSDYSFSYVAGWSEGKETPELKASLDKIRQTASEFIYQIDQKMEVLMADKKQVQESAKAPSPFVQELMDKITEGAKNLGFIPVAPETQEKTANPELKVVVDKALKDLDKKRTLSKVKESVKSKLKANTEKAEQAPKKSRTSKAKEERA